MKKAITFNKLDDSHLVCGITDTLNTYLLFPYKIKASNDKKDGVYIHPQLFFYANGKKLDSFYLIKYNQLVIGTIHLKEIIGKGVFISDIDILRSAYTFTDNTYAYFAKSNRNKIMRAMSLFKTRQIEATSIEC